MGTRSPHMLFLPSVTAVERFPMVTSAERKKQLEVYFQLFSFSATPIFHGEQNRQPHRFAPAKGEHKERL